MPFCWVQPRFRYCGFLTIPGDIDRPLDKLVFVDVSGTIAVNLGDLHPYHKLGARVFRYQLIILVGRGNTLKAQPIRVNKIHEQQTDIGVLQQVAHGLVLTVTVVVGESDGMLIDYLDEPRITAFVGAGR